MTIFDNQFLLHSDVAERLHHEVAAEQPIYNYHCHLPVDERYITGDATDRER